MATINPPPNVLLEAQHITAGDRQRYYGHPLDNHGATAALWTAYLRRRRMLPHGTALSARDVCMLNVLQKVSRDANRQHRDNLVDIAGYARNAEMVDERAEAEGCSPCRFDDQAV